jgi:ABC-type glycerol-3-phosphate transport system substrate-binding protein
MNSNGTFGSFGSKSLSRRSILGAGLAIPVGAALAACSSPTSKSTSSAKPLGPDAFKGVTLQLGTNPGDLPAMTEYAAGWKALTGGEVNVAVVPFAERAIKFAGFIASQDGSMDLLYGGPAFVNKFGERLFMDLTGRLDTKDLLSSVTDSLTLKGKLLAAPLSSDMYFTIYNKKMFADAGADPEKPPTSWDELYKLSDKLHVGDRYGSVVPWLAGYAQTYFTAMYNGSGKAMFNDDRTRVMFNNKEGLAVFETIKRGLDSKFFDPNVLSDPGADQDTAILFAQGKGASQIGAASYWAMAYRGDQTSLKPEDVGVMGIPSIEDGKFGTTNAFEGLGVNKFTKNPDACLSFLTYMTSKEGQKKMMVEGKSGLPAIRSDVLTDPEVAKIFPIGGVLAKLGKLPSSSWNTPFNVYPVFDAAVNGISKNGDSAKQALDNAVRGCNEAIAKYLSS